MFQTKNEKKIFKGSVAVFALIIMFILAVATIGIITTAAIERKVSISTGNSTTAFQIAESGMENTLQAFKRDFDKRLNQLGLGNCEADGSITYNSSGTTTTIKFKDKDGNDLDCNNKFVSEVKIIKSVGTTKLETRAIEQDVFLGATRLLLHLNGKTEGGKFEDSSFYYNNHTISTVTPGSGKIEAEATGQIPFPPNGDKASALFSGGGYLSIPDSSDWDFKMGNFTIDLWVNFTDVAGQQWLIDRAPDQRLYYTAGNLYGLGKTFAWTPSAGTWYHIALVRLGNNLSAYVNGSRLGNSQTISTDIDSNSDLYIGTNSDHSQTFRGYIDELRISKGIARWTSDFTPPAKEYWPD